MPGVMTLISRGDTLKEAKGMQEKLYGSLEEQRQRQENLRKGRELFKEKLAPKAQEAVEDILKSGNQDAIEELFRRFLKVFLKYGGDPNVIKSFRGDLLRFFEFQKEQGEGVEPLEVMKRVGREMEEALSRGKSEIGRR